MAIPALASVQGTFQRSFQVSGPVDLDVLTRSGDVTVHNGPAGSVSISGKIYVSDRWFGGDHRADVAEIEKNPPIQQSGNNIKIDYLNFHNISIDYDITVPADTTLTTRSGSGDQTIEGLNRKMTLESGSGDMRLTAITGEVRLRTGSGDVQAHDISGPIDAEAGSGDIRVTEKSSGNVRAHTGSGSIELSGVNGTAWAETGSGDVTVEGKQTGDWEVRTGSGNVNLRLPSDAAFDLDASTSSGNLEVEQPVTMTVQGNLEHERKSVQGKVRGGGPAVRVHTGSGDIRVE